MSVPRHGRAHRRRWLVYYVVGGEPGYAALLRESVASLRRHHPFAPRKWRRVDVAVLCDEAYAPHVSDLGPGVTLVTTPPNGADPVAASMRKVEAFRIPGIERYDAVVYLDCDVLVAGRLDPVFEAVTADVLYTVREGGPECHDRGYWTLGRYTPEQLAALREAGTGVFNAGQFAFRPSAAMRDHFAAVKRLIDERTPDTPFFWEQSFMNHHFNLAGATDDGPLTPLVHLAACRDPPPPTALLVHFSDASVPYTEKLRCMRCMRDSSV